MDVNEIVENVYCKNDGYGSETRRGYQESFLDREKLRCLKLLSVPTRIELGSFVGRESWAGRSRDHFQETGTFWCHLTKRVRRLWCLPLWHAKRERTEKRTFVRFLGGGGGNIRTGDVFEIDVYSFLSTLWALLFSRANPALLPLLPLNNTKTTLTTDATVFRHLLLTKGHVQFTKKYRTVHFQ